METPEMPVWAAVLIAICAGVSGNFLKPYFSFKSNKDVHEANIRIKSEEVRQLNRELSQRDLRVQALQAELGSLKSENRDLQKENGELRESKGELNALRRYIELKIGFTKPD